MKSINEYIQYLMTQKGLSPNSLISYKNDLKKFFEYLTNAELSLETLRRKDIRSFLSELTMNKIGNKSINRILSVLKGFVKYNIRFGYKDQAGILEIDSLKTPTYLPNFLFDDEMNSLINFECISASDFRDKAIFELFFSTGLRVSELIRLNFSDLSNTQSKFKVMGKGNKDRVVIFGPICRQTLNEYLKKRIELIKLNNTEEKALFINQVDGKRLTVRGVRFILQERIQKIALKKKVSPHSLRHTFATSLIKNGADIRSVQLLLGHSSLATTQIYTHLSLDELKDAHHKFHPHGK